MGKVQYYVLLSDSPLWEAQHHAKVGGEVSQLLPGTGKWERDLLIFFFFLAGTSADSWAPSAGLVLVRGRNLGLDLRSVNTVILFAYGSLVAMVEEEGALKAYEDKSGERNTQKYLRGTDQVSEKCNSKAWLICLSLEEDPEPLPFHKGKENTEKKYSALHQVSF